MVVVYHQNNKVVEVHCNEKSINFSETNVAKALFEIAGLYADEFIIWCDLGLISNLDSSKLYDIFHHSKIMVSYNPYENSFLSEGIGYVEESPFLKINSKVNYPTWQMSSYVGGIHASVLLALKDEIKTSNSFDYFLNSLAKLGMPKGLLCYSNPQLIKDFSEKRQKQKNNRFLLFRFVKQHYKKRWVFLLFLNLFLYEKRVSLLPFIFSFFYPNRKLHKNLLDNVGVRSTKKVIETGTMDVIIPTIGRKQYLYDVLKDLSIQTQLPKNVIIVEQNPDLESVSELNYIIDESWPFKIKHTFTHQTGACNARNLALAEVESEWVFLNDDDNRFDSNLIHDIFCKIEQFGINVATTSYIQPNEKLVYKTIHQSGIFGSGNSFVKTSCLQNVSFSMALEFGYGEDTDFGLQLRHQGFDVIYFPEPSILHLKAPFGGFRIKPEFAWKDEIIQPKPSPTIMYVKQKYLTQKQIAGYKLVLFFKMLKKKPVFKWFVFYKSFKKMWDVSLQWGRKI